ncbi:uncharacterized protein LOC113798362 isoform X2 [Dermatophagoides pteronyssinus]|uniref:uncharacterized protein LOC113798362 isoform X2 n=1 Tax=Dermatophagoides pteronyssinus TaxID=6956 RepID=UPI003F66D84C
MMILGKIYRKKITDMIMGQIRNSYQVIQQSTNQQNQLLSSSIISSSIFNRNFLKPSSLSYNRLNTKNLFNDRATILYRPQTSIILNDGQVKEGECPQTRPARNGYYTFKQYEGIWFKRYRSRVRQGEPFFKCAWIDYIDQGNNNIFIMDNLQNNRTGEWFRQNATTEVWPNDPTTWTSTLANGVRFDTHLIYYDGNLGVAVIYSCSPTSDNGHQGIGNIYTRSPTTPLSKSYVDFLLDIFYQNGIYDTLPLHFVDQDNCKEENLPKPRYNMI